MSLFSKDVGIDLGTANTLVYMKGKGIIMREPSVVAVDTKSDEVRCVGAEAKAVIGRTPGSIVAVRPLKTALLIFASARAFAKAGDTLHLSDPDGVVQYSGLRKCVPANGRITL